MAVSARRLQAASGRHREAAQLQMASKEYEYDESSSDEEENPNNHRILQSVLHSFTSSADGDDLGRTHQHLLNSIKPKANICLICIESIRRQDPIWSCAGCYTMFHIDCIRKWVKDGVYQHTATSEGSTTARKDIPWNCPKCRHEYQQKDCPTRYYCFCGQEEDPGFDPWLVPHSCGKVCHKELQPHCGHKCLLLCHPGPCPPCPQTVHVKCYCGSQPPQVRRCGNSQWSCGQPCGRRLNCQHHTCSEPCHSGECNVCSKTSQQQCQCGQQTAERPCSSPQWQCTQVCGKALDCGHHSCQQVCHAGQCPPCPGTQPRTCPCGKTKFELPCTEDVPTCVDTCGKLLDCKQHLCAQRCHTGPCGMCREMVYKKCRCGKKTKQVQCFKEFLCETRCSKTRDCGKHPCRRKCCDGNCPPCEQKCTKTLGCHNHKCTSMCHRGPCYPCREVVSISCHCGATSIAVPCGRERVTRPPRCIQPCQQPPDCHHLRRAAHHCHFGSCPPCSFPCDKKLVGCDHQCPVPCHSAVRRRIQQPQVIREGPWQAVPEARVEIQDLPCPPCQKPVPVTCLGKHETVVMACYMAKVSSCSRPCGRPLPCTNHTCQLPCHKVEEKVGNKEASQECQPCEEPCSKPRPEGCTHLCLQPCHPGECSPCRQMIRMRCHCQLVVRHIECDVWTHADDTERNRLKSCQGTCPRKLTCGHQCRSLCHVGSCPTAEQCLEKVRVRCTCRYKKQDFLCKEVQAGYGKVQCDESCHSNKEKQQRLKQSHETAKQEEELRHQQAEVMEYERKLAGRKKRKPRKQQQKEESTSLLQKYGHFYLLSAVMVLLALFVYYILNI